MKVSVFTLFLLLILLISLGEEASANERRFGYTYESSVLPPGVREIELWNTVRNGRSYFYRRLDQRIEYEFGVAENLMSAFYLNTTAKAKDSNGDAMGGNKSSSLEISISNEWKYKFMDRVADPFGFALYGEWTLGLDEVELEGKLIFDKQIQHVLFALDLSGEYESSVDVITGSSVYSDELKIASGIGIAYDFQNGFGAGIELRNDNIFVSGSILHSSMFGGPTFTFSSESIWATFSLLPQVYSFKGGTTTSRNIDLDEFEKIQARLLLSLHI